VPSHLRELPDAGRLEESGGGRSRGVPYERCLPLTTQDLEIGGSIAAGPDARLLGIGRLVIGKGLAAPGRNAP
jgi:hypothetical protein